MGIRLSSPNLKFPRLKLDFWEPFSEHQCPPLASLPNGSQSLQTSLFTLNFRTPSKLLRKHPSKTLFSYQILPFIGLTNWLIKKKWELTFISIQGPSLNDFSAPF